jgi:myosin heavy subunit
MEASAGALVENLMKAQPSYIRTIKPNQHRSSSEYDTKAILHQIKYLGLQENIRVRRAGFAYRNTFEKMVERFYLLSPNTSYAGEYTWQGDPRSGCQKILTDTGIAKEEWQMGVTKAFIKNPETVRDSHIRACASGSLCPAFRIGDDARSVLAQHGGTYPTRFPQLHEVQKRMRSTHSKILEE